MQKINYRRDYVILDYLKVFLLTISVKSVNKWAEVK